MAHYNRNTFYITAYHSFMLHKSAFQDIVPFDFKNLFSLNPLPDDKVLDWSKLKQIADGILKCIQNEK